MLQWFLLDYNYIQKCDIERFTYQVSIVIIIDHPDNLGHLMISRIRETDGGRYSEVLHMVILNARSGNVLVFG